MLNKKQKVIVIGAGAAGLTASIFASMNKSNEVILLERGQMAGKKILMSGGTRCNVLPASF
ncbi:MAG: NAD(P)/FAD-dependent oxidoreductase, partial [Candidatus Sericytochromatia bacterium]